MDEGRNMILLFPTLIDFKSEEDRNNFDPSYVLSPRPSCLPQAFPTVLISNLSICCRCHMFYPRRVVDVPDGKPKWTGINQSSELMDDVPGEPKKRKRREVAKDKEDGDHDDA